MIYISDKEQDKIKQKIKKLPSYMLRPNFSLILFEIVGVVVFSYGLCVGRYTHPINLRILNPTYQFLLSCFYYLALSIAAPFSGGHLNPAVTIAFDKINNKSKSKRLLIMAQVIGAVIGISVAYAFFQVVPLYYFKETSVVDLLLDLIGETFGTFVYILFMLIITQTNYMAGQYYRYMLISIMFLAGRIFTLRRGCLNPALGLIVQIFAAIIKKNGLLLLYSFTLIIGPILGGIAAVWFFKNIYQPLKDGLACKG